MEAKEHKETGASHVTHLRCQDTNPSFSGLHSARDATGAENGSKSTPFRSPIANPILVVEGGQRESPCGCRNCAADLELSSLISLLLFRSLCLLLLPVELSPPMQFQHLRALAELRAADSTQSLQMFTLTAEHHDQVRWRLIQMRRCIYSAD